MKPFLSFYGRALPTFRDTPLKWPWPWSSLSRTAPMIGGFDSGKDNLVEGVLKLAKTRKAEEYRRSKVVRRGKDRGRMAPGQ